MAKTNTKENINKYNYLTINYSTTKNIKVESEFNKLLEDKYLKSSKWKFRKRSFGKGIIFQNKLRWKKGSTFYQSKKINSYAGGIKRKFPEMSLKLKKFVKNIIEKNIIQNKLLNKKMYFGAHAIRIICNKKNKGFPVPEGFHTDGVDKVAIVPIAKKNSRGGISYLKDSKNDKIIFKGRVEKKILFFNDRKLLHYASPISLSSGKIGYRDILVITFIKKNVS